MLRNRHKKVKAKSCFILGSGQDVASDGGCGGAGSGGGSGGLAYWVTWIA